MQIDGTNNDDLMYAELLYYCILIFMPVFIPVQVLLEETAT